MAKVSAKMNALIASRYWETTPLTQMDEAQWEAICDGCAKCCLHKFIDDDVEEAHFTDTAKDEEEMFFTDIACQFLHTKTCQCTEYENRTELVPHCVKLTQANLPEIFYMPPSCSYRRMHQGKALASWHPLLNGGKAHKMHAEGMSVRNKIVSELDVNMDQFEERIVTWPVNELD